MQIDNSELPPEDNIPVTITIPNDTREIDFNQMFGYYVKIYWLQKIADNISQLSQLKTLNFINVDIGDGEFEVIAQMVKRCSSLTEVCLDKRCADSSASGYQALMDAVKSKPQENAVGLFVYDQPNAMCFS